jgi:hypothetical protein
MLDPLTLSLSRKGRGNPHGRSNPELPRLEDQGQESAVSDSWGILLSSALPSGEKKRRQM